MYRTHITRVSSLLCVAGERTRSTGKRGTVGGKDARKRKFNRWDGAVGRKGNRPVTLFPGRDEKGRGRGIPVPDQVVVGSSKGVGSENGIVLELQGVPAGADRGTEGAYNGDKRRQGGFEEGAEPCEIGKDNGDERWGVPWSRSCASV